MSKSFPRPLGTDDISIALRRAGLEIKKFENNKINLGKTPELALLKALESVVKDYP